MKFIKKCLFYLIFLCSASHAFSYENEIAICAVIKDEAPYIREWVQFHMAQGVQRFYLYDNLCTDFRYLQLDDYIACGVVQIIPWHFHVCDCREFDDLCCKAYMHCINRLKNKVRFCAFLNCREFLFCPNGFPLQVFLRKFRKSPCLCIHRQAYDALLVDGPCGQLFRYLLWKCHPKHECCNATKCIVQPKYVVGCKAPGEFILKPGYSCINEKKKPIHHGKSHVITCNKIRINFYPFRDLNYFNYNRYRTNFCSFCDDYGFDIELNSVFDDCILRVCPPFTY